MEADPGDGVVDAPSSGTQVRRGSHGVSTPQQKQERARNQGLANRFRAWQMHDNAVP